MSFTLKMASVEDLEMLYGESALTFEGTSTDFDNINWLNNWLVEQGCVAEDQVVEIYVVEGQLMNDRYGLTGSNRYPNDLHIVCVPLSQLTNIGALAIARFSLGGRWFDDVVDNNARREGNLDD